MTDSIPEQFVSLVPNLRIIGFDLDDTLWDNRSVILKAIRAQFDYLESVLNRTQSNTVSRVELEKTYQEAIETIVKSGDPRYDDMTLLRQEALALLCQKIGIDHHHATEAFQTFFHHRQQVSPFHNAQELLALLSQRYSLVAITNGNAQIEHLSIGGYFEQRWQAGIDGKAKPSGDMLKKACDHYGITAQQMLYIGDNPELDGVAAIEAGCYGLIIPSSEITEENHQLFYVNNIAELIRWFREVM